MNPRRKLTSRSTAACLVAALALAACSDDQQLADITTIAPPVTVSTSGAPTTEPAPATTEEVVDTTVVATAPDTTATPVATDAGEGATGPMFSDALGVKVDSAPGVNTPGDTRQLLPEGLYVHIAWEADPNDPSVFTVRDEDVEILEAYANAAATFYRAAITTVDTADPAFERYFVDAGAKYEAAFAQARTGGYVKNLGDGAVLRPYVLEGERSDSSAIVLDCARSAEQWVSDLSPRADSEFHLLGTAATLVKVGGTWIVDTVAEEQSACL